MHITIKKITLVILIGVISGCSKTPVKHPQKKVKEPTKQVVVEPEEVAYTLLVFGDSGTGGRDQYIVGAGMAKACKKYECDAAFILGDVVYDNGLKRVNHRKARTHIEKPYRKLDMKFYMGLGNHDHRWDRGPVLVDFGKAHKKFKMYGRHYVVPNQPDFVNIYMLDTTKMDKKQAARVKRKMCNKKGWKIVMGHHPPYSSGKHGENRKLKKYLVPVMKKCGIQFGMFGHDHNLEYLFDDSIHYVISGAAAKLRPLRKKRHKYSEWAVSQLGFNTLTLTPTRWILRFHDKDGDLIKLVQYERPKLIDFELEVEL